MAAADRATTRILEGPLAAEVLRFGAPIALGMALQTVFNLVDAYLLAQLPRTEVGPALGALGICDQVAAIGTILSYGVSTASAAAISQRKGAKDDEGVRRAAWQSLVLVGGLGALFALIGLSLGGPIMRGLIGAKGEVAEVGASYLRVIVGGSFTIFFLLQLTSIQRALGSAKTPAALLVLGNVINFFLAVLFVFGPGPAPKYLSFMTGVATSLHVPRMGMLGAAWATVIARLLVLAPNVVILLRRFQLLPPPGQRAPDGKELRAMLGVAWPSSAQFVLRIAAGLFVQSMVARAFTTESDQTATTAMGLVFRLDTMAIFVAMGWGSAAQTFVGQNLGAANELRARRSGLWTVLFDAVTNALLFLFVLRFGEWVLRVFDDDDAPVGIALRYLNVVAPSYLALGVGIVLGNAMAGAGATRTTLALDALVIFLFQVPICVVGVLAGWSIDALFRCVAVTNVVSALAYVVAYQRIAWWKVKRAATP
jgi:putative MATE family efflux protein